MEFTFEEIKAALENHELAVYYQPQYDSINGQMKSAEALVRWIKPDGTVNREGHIMPKGTVILSHPDGFVFEGFRVPGYAGILETVRSLAPTVGHFRLVSWDMAVDADGDIVLIEANMRKGGIAIHQFNNGPLFGDLTDRVLDEVFSSDR